MSLFLDNYVRGPIDTIISNAPEKLPRFIATMTDDTMSISIGNETFHINRKDTVIDNNHHDEPPDDIGDNIPG